MTGFVADFRQRVSASTREPGMASGALHSVEDMLAGSVPGSRGRCTSTDDGQRMAGPARRSDPW